MLEVVPCSSGWCRQSCQLTLKAADAPWLGGRVFSEGVVGKELLCWADGAVLEHSSCFLEAEKFGRQTGGPLLTVNLVAGSGAAWPRSGWGLKCYKPWPIVRELI